MELGRFRFLHQIGENYKSNGWNGGVCFYPVVKLRRDVLLCYCGLFYSLASSLSRQSPRCAWCARQVRAACPAPECRAGRIRRPRTRPTTTTCPLTRTLCSCTMIILTAGLLSGKFYYSFLGRFIRLIFRGSSFMSTARNKPQTSVIKPTGPVLSSSSSVHLVGSIPSPRLPAHTSILKCFSDCPLLK